MNKHYLVIFSVPPLSEMFIAQIPNQRKAVDELMNTGKLLTYSLTKTMDKLFVVFNADTEEELEELIHQLPLSPYMKYHHVELYFHLGTVSLPAISLN